MKKLEGTPKSDGFRMPAEYEPHRGTYIIWPERPDNWRLGAKPAQKVFLEVIETSKPTQTTTDYRQILDTLKTNAEYILN